MKYLLLISLILLFITGCYEMDNNSSSFEWATVDTSLIEPELYRIAATQNPFPSEIKVDDEQLHKDINRLSIQINAAAEKCLTVKVPPNTKVSGYAFDTTHIHDKECLAQVNADPLISDLIAKKDQFIHENYSPFWSKSRPLVARKCVRNLVCENLKNAVNLYQAGRMTVKRNSAQIRYFTRVRAFLLQILVSHKLIKV
jgi:hypothetical protein